jgi:hypothetical protein
MSKSTAPIGSVGYWGMMRLLQVAMICIGFLIVFLAGRPSRWELDGFLILWFLFAIYLDTEVYGYADEDGVHFRRYISMQFVPWKDTDRVSWFGKNILSIHLRAGNYLRRELNANSSSSRSIFYNMNEEPELVKWLLVAKPSGAVGLELGPWGTETASSPKTRILIQIIVAIFSAAILIWFLVTVRATRS